MTTTPDDQRCVLGDAVGGGRSCDEDVVALLTTLPEDVPGVVATLEQLQVLAQRAPRCAEDGLGCFNYLYREITEEVLDQLATGAMFHDGEFLAQLDVEFARRYFVAVRADAAGQWVPAAWRVLLQRRADRSISPLRFAMAGVNAHVDYDLAFALVSTCTVLGRTLTAAERVDYDAINTIFAGHMAGLRQHFEDHFQRELDQGLFTELADGAGDLSVVMSRDAAWHRAEHLWTLRGRPEELERARAAIDWRASMLGLGMLGSEHP